MPLTLVSLAVNIVLTAAFLKLIAAILRDFKINGWAVAFGLAFLMSVIQFAVSFLLPAEMFGWVRLLISVAASVPVLAVAAALIPGAKVGGIGTLFAAALLLAVSSVAGSFAMFVLAIG